MVIKMPALLYHDAVRTGKNWFDCTRQGKHLVIYMTRCTKKKKLSAYAKTKAQISFAVAAKLISAFVFTTRIVQFLLYLNAQNFKILALFCDCTGRFVSGLVGNPEDHFPCVVAHILLSPVVSCVGIFNLDVSSITRNENSC